jgi:hypothetical protein
MPSRLAVVAGSVVVLVATTGAPHVGASADDQARLDAAIAGFEQRMTNAGWTSQAPADDDDGASIDLDIDEMSEEDAAFAECFGELGVPVEGDLEELPGETARSESDDYAFVETSEASETTELFSFDFDGETISAFAVSVDESELATVERFVEVFGAKETADCLQSAFDSLMAGEIEGADVPVDFDVEVTTASDLGIGDQNARFELSLSGEVMGFSVDTVTQLVMSRVGSDLVAVAYVALGEAVSGIDPVEELQLLVDEL